MKWARTMRACVTAPAREHLDKFAYGLAREFPRLVNSRLVEALLVKP
jgi:hypothetical protein